MDTLIMCACLMITLCCMAICVFLLKSLTAQKPEQPEQPEQREEMPEELEARRMAAKAQMLYEQGFVNMMNYDGSPKNREEREQL